MNRCPCGRPLSFDRCCGPILAGAAEAATPEDLMRSRYTAFVRGDVAHLLRSWAPETRPITVDIDPALRWTGLEVLDVTTGVVEFRAAYVRAGVPAVLHERSRFRRHDGRWVYLDGNELPS